MTSTVCDHCVFALKETIETDDGSYTHQFGCELNRIDKFQNEGVNIIPGIDDTGNEFLVLENCICTAMRTKDWIKLKDNIDRVEEIKKELEMQYQWILIDDGTLDNLRERLLEIQQQRIKPGRVVVIRPFTSTNCNVTMSRILTKFTKFCGGRWSIENLVEGVSIDEGIDCSLIRYKYPFYIYSNSSSWIDPNISDKINSIINDDLRIFAMITVDNVTVVPQVINTQFQGSYFGVSLKDKLLQECSDKVINVSQTRS